MNNIIELVKRNKFFFSMVGLISLHLVRKNSSKKKIFVSFAIEDKKIRDLLVGQAKNSSVPFDFIDRSVYQPWKSAWKSNCRIEIKECDGVIALLSNKTWKADGQRWEIKCAQDESIPILPMHAYKTKNKRGKIPPELNAEGIINWEWKEIVEFIEAL